MKVKHKEICRTDPTCELRVGDSSWDENEESVKYAWFTSAGVVARGGEIPLKAFWQIHEMLVRLGKIRVA